ncbi:hypothetical protein M885DRAFT_547898 [Pelagophyceae sp. CCMP2097]|nr:hypothetical protein M885DRAFT_547898 [Pelagophyceae sp. CCMP2097]
MLLRGLARGARVARASVARAGLGAPRSRALSDRGEEIEGEGGEWVDDDRGSDFYEKDILDPAFPYVVHGNAPVKTLAEQEEMEAKREREGGNTKDEFAWELDWKGTDALADSITYIDDVHGRELIPIPRSQPGVDIEQAVIAFLERDFAVPGPYTVIYCPPYAGPRYPTPDPRSLKELVDYTHKTRHVDTSDASPSSFLVKDVCDHAWQQLSHQARYTEENKKYLMEAIHRILTIEENTTLMDEVLVMPSDQEVAKRVAEGAHLKDRSQHKYTGLKG